MDNYFSAEIRAPEGLDGIQKYLSECDLNIVPYKSGYNGKVILKTESEATFKWSMDSSDSDIVYISGEFYDGKEITFNKLQSFSEVLIKMKLPHIILIDDENSILIKTIKYEWQENT